MDINKYDSRNDSKRTKNDEDLPGYPHYPPDEDIMNPQNGAEKISQAEDLANSSILSNRILNSRMSDENGAQSGDQSPEDNDDDLRIVSGTEADLDEEDFILLGDKDADMDMQDDELVHGNSRVDSVDDEEELDIPGAELDNEEEAIGEEDEENNYYSLGGDRQESIEDDPMP